VVWISVCGSGENTREICAPSTFWDFRLTAWLYLGIPLYCPLDGKRTLFNASTAIENQTFGASLTKKIL